jgi:uncharacterized damage-inducible protein DinB
MARDILQDLLRGRGAHVDPVAVVASVRPELAGRRLSGAEHTIWQLVWHMNYWMNYELRSLEGPEARYPEHAAESWPPVSAPADTPAWEAEVTRFRVQVEALAMWGRRAAEEGIQDRLLHARHEDRIGDVLWQMAAHNSYHTGQVALLLRAFGAWPPPGGGDTW